MNKQINRQLEVCHMTLERALQGVGHMRQISQLPDLNPKSHDDPAMDLFVDSLVLSQSKITSVSAQLSRLKTGIDKVMKHNVRSN